LLFEGPSMLERAAGTISAASFLPTGDTLAKRITRIST
jgi:hypothetical protein